MDERNYYIIAKLPEQQYKKLLEGRFITIDDTQIEGTLVSGELRHLGMWDAAQEMAEQERRFRP